MNDRNGKMLRRTPWWGWRKMNEMRHWILIDFSEQASFDLCLFSFSSAVNLSVVVNLHLHVADDFIKKKMYKIINET